MIGYLKGTIKNKTAKTLILEINGVGYTIFTTQVVREQSKVGQGLELYIYTNVREDALELYGLPTIEEIEFFKKLIGISGVGPKSALGIFEVAALNEIKKAISRGDASLLTKVSGIGKKTAELIIVKLKDKDLDIGSILETGSHGDAIDALVGLGYSAADAREILTSLPPDLPLEEKVKAALKKLGKK